MMTHALKQGIISGFHKQDDFYMLGDHKSLQWNLTFSSLNG